jgi:hypothetical protein
MKGNGKLTIFTTDGIDNSIMVTVTDTGISSPPETRQEKKGWGMG